MYIVYAEGKMNDRKCFLTNSDTAKSREKNCLEMLSKYCKI